MAVMRPYFIEILAEVFILKDLMLLNFVIILQKA